MRFLVPPLYADGPICLTRATIMSFSREGYASTGAARSDNEDGVKKGEAQMDTVRVEKNGPVTTVILSRPDVRNAVDRPTAEALARAFLQFERDEEALVGVFAGDHGTFCAGADLKAVSQGPGGGNRTTAPGTGLDFDRLAADGPMGPSRMVLSKPVIGAIAGYAVAGGLELALWCDMRVVEEDAQLGVFCRRWGVPLIDGGTVRLPRLIGHSRAMDLILTGRPVGADEALAMGLANRVVPKGEARAEAERLAADIARFPQLCLKHDRLSAYEQWDLPYDQAIANEFEHGRKVLASGETFKGAARFAGGKGRGGRFDEI
jgi:enoyl-CoA hydratase